MDSSKPADDVNGLLERMKIVRATGYDHAGELHVEAKRLVDWKEYVRAKPLMSVAVASLVGFSIVRVTLGTSSRAIGSTDSSIPSLERSISRQSSWTSGAMALVTNVASTAIKHYIVSLLQTRRTEGNFNDRFRNNGTHEQNIGSDK